MGAYGSPELHPAFHKGEEPEWNKNMVYCRKCGFKYSRVFDCCPQCGKKRCKPLYKRFWFWLLIIIAVLLFVPIPQETADEIVSVIESKTTQTWISEKDYKANCSVISYEDISRYPNKYKGQKVVFKGYVYNVVEDTYNKNNIVLLVAVTETGVLGLWDDIFYVDYHKPLANESRILKGDIIRMYGEYKGIYTYQTILETSATLPRIAARFIDIEQ